MHPVLDAYARALPLTFEGIDAPEGTHVMLRITGDAGGTWSLLRRDVWTLYEGIETAPDAVTTLDQDTAWRLFTKAITPARCAAACAARGRRCARVARAGDGVGDCMKLVVIYGPPAVGKPHASRARWAPATSYAVFDITAVDCGRACSAAMPEAVHPVEKAPERPGRTARAGRERISPSSTHTPHDAATSSRYRRRRAPTADEVLPCSAPAMPAGPPRRTRRAPRPREEPYRRHSRHTDGNIACTLDPRRRSICPCARAM